METTKGMKARSFVLSDIQQVLRLRQECTTAENRHDYPGVSDLPVLLDSTAAEAVAIYVWEEASSQIIAYAILLFSTNALYFLIHPRFQGRGIETQALNWAAEQLRIHAQKLDIVMKSPCRISDSSRKTILEQHGFQELYRTLRLIRTFADPLPNALFPGGFTWRPLKGSRELEEYVTMHREAFGTTEMTLAYRRSFMKQAIYDPEFDLVAVDSNDVLAAFCFCSIVEEANADNISKEGEIITLGTRPAFRNRGLGYALLLVAMQRLKVAGADYVVLGTRSVNAPALRLYMAAGFLIEYERLWYARPL